MDTAAVEQRAEGSDMKAVGTNVIVEEIPPPEVSAGGVFLSPSARADQELNRGRVLSVGAKVRESIIKGDIVCFTKYEGHENRMKGPNGDPLVFLNEPEVMAVELS